MSISDVNPLISVVIPAYNTAEFIGRTLESVLNQTFRDVEVVVVDDGSTDDTARVVKRFCEKDGRVVYLRQENRGVSAARNAGMAKARGTFVSFLDSDDTYEPAFLETMSRNIQATQGDLYYCGYYYRSGEKIIDKIPQNFDMEDPVAFVLSGGRLTLTGCFCIRYSFLEENGICFTEGCSVREDAEFFNRLLYLASSENRFQVKDWLFNYYIRSGSLSQRGNYWFTLRYMVDWLGAEKRLYDYMKGKGLLNTERYLSLVSLHLKKSYLWYLWGTLLMGTREEFETLWKDYGESRAAYALDVPLKGIKYRIWAWCIGTVSGRRIGRLVFRPYKYLQRSWKRLK